MGLCPSRTLGGDGDVLGSTNWLRMVVTGYQTQRSGISKFCKFSFEPLASTCIDEESCNRVSVGFLDAKGNPREVHWIIRISQLQHLSTCSGPLLRECQIRRKFMPILSKYLQNSGYKRANLLVNIPDLIYLEDKTLKNGRRSYLVLEDISKTKKCNQLSQLHLQTGLGLSELNTVLATLAQFHAAVFAWTQSHKEDPEPEAHQYLHLSPWPCSKEECLDLLQQYSKVLNRLLDNKLSNKKKKKLKYLEQLSGRLPKIENKGSNKDLETVGLPLISPLDLAFQYAPPVASPQLTEDSSENCPSSPTPQTPMPACAAVTRVGNITYSSLPRDLACWIFTLANHTVRRYYLLDVISNYLTVLTNALDLLSVSWEDFGISFHKFCCLFYEQVEVGLLVSIIVAMRDTSEENLEDYLDGSVEEASLLKIAENKASSTQSSIPLTAQRLDFLLHLLDDVHKFC